MKIELVGNFLRNIARQKIQQINRIASISALNAGEAEFRDRIFKRGESKTGAKIGTYKSKKHIDARKRKGLQTAFKDYFFTSNLFASLKKIEYGNTVSLAIVDTIEIAKSRENEKRDKKAVFFLNSKEVGKIEREYELSVRDLLGQISFE